MDNTLGRPEILALHWPDLNYLNNSLTRPEILDNTLARTEILEETAICVKLRQPIKVNNVIHKNITKKKFQNFIFAFLYCLLQYSN